VPCAMPIRSGCGAGRQVRQRAECPSQLRTDQRYRLLAMTTVNAEITISGEKER
jgi:hypothetical protein